MSLDELNQRISITTIKPVVFDGKRVVAEKNRIEEVANRLYQQFGGRLKSVQKLLLLGLNPEYVVDLLPLPIEVTVK